MNAADSSDSPTLSDIGDSENMNSSDDEKPPVPWTELPCIAVENIYLQLSREEQCHMSMVCRNWNKEYSHPSLWRQVKFLIPELDLNLEVYPEVQFARKYGGMFHHVEIVCRRVRQSLLELIWKQLKLFLEALTLQSQLKTVTFLYMNRYFRRLDDTTFEDIYQTTKSFFSSQHKLQTVEFRNAWFKKSEAAEILNIIFRQNSKSLTHLCLDAFVDESSDDEITGNVGNEAATFESLLSIKTLRLDYSHIFENIMTTFYECAQNSDTKRLKGNLELINITCDGSERISYRGIPPECWKLITRICPSLRINLTFRIEAQITNTINLFVVLNMPLKVLDFQWHRCQSGSETEIGVLFRHLQSCRTNEHLEELSIVWLRNMNNLPIDLINFLQVCEKLRVLHLFIEHPVESLDIVFISWLENRPLSLQSVCITVGNVRNVEEVEFYTNMADDYCPLLQSQGLNLLLIVDSEIRPRRVR